MAHLSYQEQQKSSWTQRLTVQKFTWNDMSFKYLFSEFKILCIHCSNGHSHKRENIFPKKLNKIGIQIFFIWPWEEWVLVIFSPRPPLFFFLAHKSHHLLPPLSSCACPIASRPATRALHGAAMATQACGPASALKIFHGPTKSRATLSGSLGGISLPRAMLAPARWLRPRFCPWSSLSQRL
jgi:hypothetical protein